MLGFFDVKHHKTFLLLWFGDDALLGCQLVDLNEHMVNVLFILHVFAHGHAVGGFCKTAPMSIFIKLQSIN